METKVCTKCGRELSVKDFYLHNKKENRRRNVCKHCYIERQSITGGVVKHRVKLHPVKPEAKTEDKPKKKRVANGQGDRSQYTHKYYITHKVKLKAKNAADYIKRRLDIIVERQEQIPTGRTCKDNCGNYPCFWGIDNIESNLSVTCHGFKPRANA